ncbi:uncharacterized protein SCODWIG_03136 [Saccharomycodes ludwigii]|uniref:Uncharacterized protein n=1 Tax=Saccharomycodes ludwigii TaxID=36035 RepID=A0A376B9L7_9ASCO|nr:hypothetical protein SCDLUD_000306 [Saccharomycodes ludwigii]KAH3902721.1 hypothetical protein SCDLUD_000306 [Saccharomycodes ludwigii]SSD61375.1 uncharacterized protein SCODWIG_03136 [Saccharomycodes ludwigii]
MNDPLQTQSNNNSNFNNAEPLGPDLDHLEEIQNPWLRASYKSALEFFQRDNVLDTADRETLFNNYAALTRSELAGGWGAFAAVFGTPFAYQYYKTKGIRGVQVPRNFIFGLGALMLGTWISGKMVYAKQLDILQKQFYEPDNTNRAYRQYNMMTLLPPGEAARWAGYFQTTAINPARKVVDPRLKFQNVENKIEGKVPPSGFLSQRDPMNLYSRPGYEKNKGSNMPTKATDTMATDNNTHSFENSNPNDVFQINFEDDGENINKNNNIPEVSAWEKIRRQNNVDGLPPSSSKE